VRNYADHQAASNAAAGGVGIAHDASGIGQAIVEVAVDAVAFQVDHMARECLLQSHFRDHVGDLVERQCVADPRLGREFRAARNVVDQFDAGEEVAAVVEGRLRVLYGDREPQRLVEVRREAHLGLARPVEAGNILRVDRERDDFVARGDALRVHRHQRPGLAGQQLQSAE